MLKLERRPSFSGSHDLDAPGREASSGDHRRVDRLPGAQRCSQLESDRSPVQLKNTCVRRSVQDMCLQEPEQEPVMLAAEPLDPSSRGPVLQEAPAQNAERTDVRGSEPASNGHLTETSEEPPANGLDSIPPPRAPVDPSRKLLDLPRIVKHKPSSITFSDCTDQQALTHESSDDGESSLEDEEEDGDHADDDDDDDVFLELPLRRELLASHRCRSNSKDGLRRRDDSSRNSGYEAEGESSSKEVSRSREEPDEIFGSHLKKKMID